MAQIVSCDSSNFNTSNTNSSTDDYCEAKVGPGSYCRLETRQCSNPLERGCLAAKLPEWQNRTRVCNSDDPDDAAEHGICHHTPFGKNYMELRILASNWESIIIESWILQIILSEILEVPATIEAGNPAQLSLYHPYNGLEVGSNQDPATVESAYHWIDCQYASRDPEQYEPCAHFTPELWDADSAVIRDRVRSGVVEPPQEVGILAEESWFVTKFTVEHDPTVASYIGLQGEENRKKLAATFLRPTTWLDYCEQVSSDGCATPDTVAQRAPLEESEYSRMFVPDLYTGYFRATKDNDCDLWPTNCTGHIADYPCGWTSYVEAQTYHLGIALSKGGYNDPALPGYEYAQVSAKSCSGNSRTIGESNG